MGPTHPPTSNWAHGGPVGAIILSHGFRSLHHQPQQCPKQVPKVILKLMPKSYKADIGQPRGGQMSTSTTFWAGLKECQKIVNFWIGQKSSSWCPRAVYGLPTLIGKNPVGCQGGDSPTSPFLIKLINLSE